MLWAVDQRGEHIVAWQWMGLLAKCLGVWPFVEGEDESYCMPVTIFPIVFGLQGMFFLKSVFTVQTGKYLVKNPWELTINMVTFDQFFIFFIFTSCNMKFWSEIFMWVKPLINMQWWCFVSLGILHCSLTCLPALAVWRYSLANHGVQRWAFYQWECKFHGVGVCRLCWASLYSKSNGWVSWLAARSDLRHPQKKWNSCACQLH